MTARSLMALSYFPPVLKRLIPWRNEIIVAAFIVISYWLVYPIGEYAILDDWIFVKSLEHLHHEGRLDIPDWTPMSLVGHLWWGLLFTKLAGFSFTVTKISVVVAHGIECFTLLWLLRLCNVRPNLALAAVLTLLFQPLHFVHCYMYMTDIPAIAWQLLALCSFVSGLKEPEENSLPIVTRSVCEASCNPAFPRLRVGLLFSCHWLRAAGRKEQFLLGLGSFFTGFSFITRQHGILVLIAFAGYLWIWERRRLKSSSIACAFGPAIVMIGSLSLWYRFVHGWTSTFSTSLQRVTDFVSNPPIHALPYIVFAIVFYIGLFLVPLACSVPLKALRLRFSKKSMLVVAATWILVNLFGYYTIAEEHYFPYIPNVINRWGYYQPHEFIVGNRDVVWSTSTSLVIGVAGLFSFFCFGCVATTERTTDSIEPSVRRTTKLLWLLLGLQLLYSFATAPLLYDRHLLIMAPTTILLFALLFPKDWKLNRVSFSIALMLFAFYSIAGTHSLHSVSRAAFRAGEDLIENDVDARNIDGGFAFDGWYMYERTAAVAEIEPIHGPVWWPNDDSSWVQGIRQPWWVEHLITEVDPEHAISVSPEISELMYRGEHNFAVYRTDYSFRAFWPWEEKTLFVLRDRR